MRKLALLCLVMLASFPARAGDPELARLFERAGVAGTLVLVAPEGGATFIHDEARARRRLPAASTFKIAHTLIALEERVVAGADTVFEWDGTMREIPDWNRDQTLESAFRASCVWCYQALARGIGAARYRHWIAALGYGELRIPFDATTFWLDGALTISAVEQVEFLQRVYRRAPPVAAASYATLGRIMCVEEGPELAMCTKTGWATRGSPRIGWYVGYVETPRGAWFFALNIDTRDAADLPLRQRLVREALRAKGVVE